MTSDTKKAVTIIAAFFPASVTSELPTQHLVIFHKCLSWSAVRNTKYNYQHRRRISLLTSKYMTLTSVLLIHWLWNHQRFVIQCICVHKCQQLSFKSNTKSKQPDSTFTKPQTNTTLHSQMEKLIIAHYYNIIIQVQLKSQFAERVKPETKSVLGSGEGLKLTHSAAFKSKTPHICIRDYPA